jgi:hypothetical protein
MALRPGRIKLPHIHLCCASAPVSWWVICRGLLERGSASAVPPRHLPAVRPSRAWREPAHQHGRPGVLNASRWLAPLDTISPRLRRPTIPKRSRASGSHPDANPSASAARHEPNPGSTRSRTSPTAGGRRNLHADARRPRPIALRHLLAPHTDVEVAPTSPADCGTGSGA